MRRGRRRREGSLNRPTLTISGEPPKKGDILDALRRSPPVGAELDVSRPVTHGRKVEL
jgi:hypothetical protein